MLKRNLIYFIAIMLIVPLSSYADIGPLSRKLDWNPITKLKISDTKSVVELSFSGARYASNTGSLPIFKERFIIGSANTEVEASITDQVWEDLNSTSIKQLNGYELIGDRISVESGVAIERKQPYATMSFIPLRKNPSSGKYQKLISFTINLKLIAKYAPEGSVSRVYKQNSVLASGSWYKFAVQFTGVHKITYDDLAALGMNIAAINPRNIRVYGNGGGMLPEPCAAFRYDDLMENAIFVSGEADGSFDQGDYILFYGESPNTWKWDPNSGWFIHAVNLYSNYTYYFINTDLGQGKRIQNQASVPQAGTDLVKKFTDMKFIEEDDLNIVKTGRDWFEYPPYEVQTTKEYAFNFPDIDVTSKVKMRSRIAARSNAASNFKYYLNGSQLIQTISASTVSLSGDQYANTASDTTNFNVGSSGFNIKVSYSKPQSASIGWMDYIALNVRRHLVFSGGHLAFRDPESTGPGKIAEYQLSNANANITVWNVTDAINVTKVGTTLSSSVLKFKLPADSLNEFVAFDGSSFFGITPIGMIPNQNLHAINTPDLIIVTHKNFLSEASRVGNHHRDFDGLDVFVVDVEQIYNEFSSGAQDITAIRDFVKMLYDEASAGNECRYLLLFGDASFDYKNRIDDNSNFVPTWEDKRSMNIINSIATDDFYGFLDDGEGTGAGKGLLDIGIGRIVVSNQESARSMVDKIIHYATGGAPVYGSWRNVVCFVADDEDGNMHMEDHAEKMAVRLDTTYGWLNVDKIYLDAYPQISTSGGQRAPAVNEAINRRIEKGALVMNYTGHGGEAGWAHERILEIADINSWTNYDKLPIFITATCEFSRYDDPTRVSAGELVYLNQDGGGLALFTTARATYGSPNFSLNNAMYDYMFIKENDEYLRFGDLIRYAKNKSGGISDNDKKFILIGDPALTLAYPEHDIQTIKINDVLVSNQSDTIKALQKVTVTGSVIGENGSVLTSFNGILRPTVYDKPTKVQTLVTDSDSDPFTFELLMAILYKGKANVINGNFTFSFIVPKDIAYNYGYGKISYYVNDANTDGTGFFKKVVIGGYDNNVPPDNTGPEIELYLNDESFVFGGITNENPTLLAYVNDSSGINTVGTGIGHDIVSTLDNDNNKSVVINDYYESDIDSYSSGVINYPLSTLSVGNHSLKLKVWDVHNNSSESYTEFVVAESAELAIDHVLNYPNPFTTSTAFYFEHNQPNSMLEAQVQIFSVSGRLIKTIDEFVMTNGYRSEPIYWDGLDDFGDRIGRGVYIYKVRVRSQDGTYAEKLEKLVILR